MAVADDTLFRNAGIALTEAYDDGCTPCKPETRNDSAMLPLRNQSPLRLHITEEITQQSPHNNALNLVRELTALPNTHIIFNIGKVPLVEVDTCPLSSGD